MESCTNFWATGNDHFHIPLHNTYVPVRHTLMPKPDIRSKDELGYSLNHAKKKNQARESINPIS